MPLSLLSDLLVCPVCGGAMALVGRVLHCVEGHGFDVARQGYVTLTSGRIRHPGDSGVMVQARERVHRSGAFAGAARSVVRGVPDDVGVIADVGGGTGYYAAAVLSQRLNSRGLVLDSSKPALQRAARSHERVAAVGCDIVSALPVRSGAVDTVIAAFAPRNVAEFARILGPRGVAIIVTPQPQHLCEIATTMKLLDIDPAKSARVDEQMSGLFEPVDRTQVVEKMLVTRDLAADLTLMGPAGFHATPAQIVKRTDDLAPVVATTFAVTITTYLRA